MQVRLPLQRAIKRSSSKTLSELVVSLQGNIDVFSLDCVSEIEITEDFDTGAIEVRLVKTLGQGVLILHVQAMYLDLYQPMMKYTRLADPE